MSGWESITGDEQDDHLDRIVVYATIRDREFTQTSLQETLKDRSLDVPIEELRRSLRRLELAYYVRRNEGDFQYCVPLFVDMLLAEDIAAALDDECSRWLQRDDSA